MYLVMTCYSSIGMFDQSWTWVRTLCSLIPWESDILFLMASYVIRHTWEIDRLVVNGATRHLWALKWNIKCGPYPTYGNSS